MQQLYVCNGVKVLMSIVGDNYLIDLMYAQNFCCTFIAISKY